MSFTTSVNTTFLQLCRNLNTPRSLSAHLLLEAGEFEQFLSLDVKPLDYLSQDHEKFRADYMVSEYLSKYEGHVTGIDTARVALDGFTAAEEQCRLANRRIHDYSHAAGVLQLEIPPGFDSIIHRARSLILRAIGEKPDYAQFASCCKWGSGTTYSIPGYEVRVDNKVRENRISITRRAIRYFRYAMSEDHLFLNARRIPSEGPTSLCNREFVVVHGGRGMTVPKNAKTDRFICNEPSGNIFLQLGVGKMLRLALKRVGVNLNDQTINQELASLAVSLGLATVDMKSASDTICRALVWLLLPPAWARLLDDLRSPFIEIKDDTGYKWIEAEKFSAMGNGYTFELESLIFWSLTSATRDECGVKGRISVYGDDIICPQSIVPLLAEVFHYVGFTFNTKKTHMHSGFRESCGEHYFWGRRVTPVYQKEVINPITSDQDLPSWYRYRNRLLYWAIDWVDVVCDNVCYAHKAARTLIKDIDKYILQQAPKGSITYVPVVSKRHRSLDDGMAVSANSDKLKLKWHGWSFSTRALTFKAYEEQCHAGAYYSVYMRSRVQNQDDLLPFLTDRNASYLAVADHVNGVRTWPKTSRIVRELRLYGHRLQGHRQLDAYDTIGNMIAVRPPKNDDFCLLNDSGFWEVKRKYYSEPLVLSWQGV